IQEEADVDFPFTPVPVKSEDDEEKPPVSQLQQTEEEEEDCGGPDPNRNCGPGRCLQPDNNTTSNCSETEGGDVGFRQSREAVSHVGYDAAKRSCDSPECGEGLGSNDHLHIHLKTFTCPYCGKRFTKSSNLTTHLRVHTGEKPFTCSVCNTSFSLRCTLVNHMRVHTGEKPFSCSVCGKRFSKKANLTTHMALHTEEKPFKCSVCGKRFTWHSQVKNHKSCSPLCPVTFPLKFIETRWLCPQCSPRQRKFICPTVCSIVKISLNHQQGQIVKTPALSSESAARADHKRHPQEHSEIQKGEKPFGCSVCGKRYHQGKLLIIHSKLHSKEKRHFKRSGDVGCTEEKPFSCSLCGKRFEKSYNLIAHVRVHTGEKPFTCSVCKTCFKTRHALMNHMRIHTGEKPFRCSVCGKRFVQSGSLKQHTSVHTEEKPYSCNACDKRFSLLTYLRRHKCVSKFSSKRRSRRNAC
uniref:C2H2-type domain-containing protein n=1 Tax=Lates calcarifer TaxID=8187 RepID=A0A4W6CKJ4_LATCA